MATARISALTIKNNVFVVNLLAAIFGDRGIEDSREKGE